jgi:hypothetical protein
LRNAIVGGLGAVLAGIVLLALGAHVPYLQAASNESGKQAAPQKSGKITNVQQEVAALGVWSGMPETYAVGDLKATVSDAVRTATGRLAALTPPELWRRGPDFAGRPIFLVGQVRELARRRRQFIPGEEIVVVGRDPGYRVFLATNNPALAHVQTDDLVYALGYLVATGYGNGLRVGYFVSVDASGAGEVSDLSPSNPVARRAREASVLPL